MRRLEYEAENKLYLAEIERIKISKEHERKLEEIKKNIKTYHGQKEIKIQKNKKEKQRN